MTVEMKILTKQLHKWIFDQVEWLLCKLILAEVRSLKALVGKLEYLGEASLQNGMELVHSYLNQIPSYGHREVLVLYPAPNSCDLGDIVDFATMREIKMAIYSIFSVDQLIELTTKEA
ncbi:unnamed protein product [Citrullus colocynthis]|uniref:Ssl1-like domain-containing protein n=1 Tax=Citrullus colocynthis TaxID=252529 RepID=A0ABP0Z350_9ROSI